MLTFLPKLKKIIIFKRKYTSHKTSDWKNLDLSTAINYKSIEFKGTKFKINYFVCDSSYDEINFHRIVDILKFADLIFLVPIIRKNIPNSVFTNPLK